MAKPIVQNISKDGNCLFRSVSFCVYGTEALHSEIRSRVVHEVIQNWNDYAHFIVGDPTYSQPINNSIDYANLISRDGEYGGDVELTSISKIFPDFQFRVYSDDNFENWVTRGNGSKISHLRFSGNRDKGHYDVLLFGSDYNDRGMVPGIITAGAKRGRPKKTRQNKKSLTGRKESEAKTPYNTRLNEKRRAVGKSKEGAAEAMTTQNSENINDPNQRVVSNLHLNRPNIPEISESTSVTWKDKSLSAFSYSPKFDYSREVSIGSMNVVCEKCNALTFHGEPKGICCCSGKVRLIPLQPPPEPLKSLLNGEHPDSVHFLHQIRAYNSAFQMTSFGATEISEGNFMPTFKVQGQVYHLIGSLLPSQDSHSKFLQIYFVSDYRSQVNIRLNVVPTLKQSLVQNLQEMLHETNPFINSLKTALENFPRDASDDFKIVIHADKKPANEHRGRYNEPSTNEVAVLMVGENCDRRDIFLRMRDDSLKRISETHRSYDALQYPLMLPRGDDGYSFSVFQVDPFTGVENSAKKVSALQFYAYRIMVRLNETNFLLCFKNLSNQFWVDMWAKIETERFLYIRLNQKQLRAENYIHLQDALRADEDGDNCGRLVILPSTHHGSPRYMHEKTQDGFCYIRKYGRPDLFITMTTNPKWIEIKNEPMPGQSPVDRHDIVARVFNLKLKKLMDLLTKFHIFGEPRCHMYSVEWQKRGLPHAHILLWLTKKIKPDQIDQIIRAEFPNPDDDPFLFQIVKSHMIHGPCGALNPDAPCMKNGKCTKNYPTPFTNETVTGDDGYPKYRRRDSANGGYTASLQLKNKQLMQVDNSWVVPYSPVLSRAFETHINVEYCNSVKSVKYICKYVNKGSDGACFSVQNKYNEILRYQSARYISTSEAVWKILSFPVHGRAPPVEHLDVHLENFQRVYFSPSTARNAIENPRNTTLMAFFKLCQRDAFVKTLLYENVPAYYTFDKQKREFYRRQRGSPVEGFPEMRWKHVLGRVYTIHPANRECFYLRLLLHNVPGPTSFQVLKSVDGVQYETFQAACKARGLLEDDGHWDSTLLEAKFCDSPSKIRHLFAVMLVFCSVSDPKSLWTKYKDSLSEDIARKYQTLFIAAVPVYSAWVENECLRMIEDIVLSIGGQPLGNYGLGSPQRSNDTNLNLEYLREVSYDQDEMLSYVNNNIENLTDEQKSVFTEILSSVETSAGETFFLDAPGGTGKTYLINLILAKIRSAGKIALAVASSGLAATLLPGGKTAHSAFGIPIDINSSETPVCNISKNSNKAKVLKDCVLIVWDECTMAHKKSIEAVERTLRDILDTNKTFGGITVLFSGDFRQTLPVIARGTRADEVNACLKRSFIWPKIKRRCLTMNMRALQSGDAENAKKFADLLLKIGNGDVAECDGFIPLSVDLGEVISSIEALIPNVYPDIESLCKKDNSWLCERAILAPLNDSVVAINSVVIEKFHSQEIVYTSIDSVIDQDDAVHYPTEFLNSIFAPGLPLHKLKLKVGAPIMLLRNLSAPKLCNGTRLRIKSLHKYLIEAVILTGSWKGESVLIPRIPLFPSNYPFQFKRLQFPVSLCFAMTINKSQGETLKIAGVDLRSDCFAHGQLYVACSRVSGDKHLYLCVPQKRAKNVVYKEA